MTEKGDPPGRPYKNNLRSTAAWKFFCFFFLCELCALCGLCGLCGRKFPFFFLICVYLWSSAVRKFFFCFVSRKHEKGDIEEREGGTV
jgi:hypothetical protein